MSQAVVAENLGISQAMLSKLETGKASLRINLETLTKATSLFGFSSTTELIAAAEFEKSLEEEITTIKSTLQIQSDE